MINTPKGQVEKQFFVDIRELKRRGVLIAGSSTTITLIRNERPTGQLLMKSITSGILWGYRSLTDNDRSNDSFGNRIEVVDTKCHFGNTRPWFSCPTCHKRVAVLYCARSTLMCRTCGQINYASQQMTELDYKLRQVAFRRERLGAGDMFLHKLSRIDKPKYMRYTTYFQYLGELHLLEKDILAKMVSSFG